MSKFLNLTCALLVSGAAAQAESYDSLGRTATPAEIAAWDIDVRPDGMGLPEGSGSVAYGEEVFADRCAVCHGDFGEAVGRWPVLSGGYDTLDSEDPVKTIGSYWPYLSTVWDYVNRAMPFGDAQSLSPDEVYGITAYLLYVNDVVDDEEFVLSRTNFLEIPMENVDNFYMDDRAETELAVFTEACMENCKPTVEVTKRAAVVDVTPEDSQARKLREAANQARASKVEAAEAETVEVAQAAPAAAATAAVDPELAKKGEKVYKKCKACHQVGEGAKNKTGPALNGIFGRVAGSVDGFKYSKVFQQANADGLVWNETELAAFLAKPKAYMPKTKMSFVGLKKETDLAAIIAYLRTFDE